MKNHYFFSFSGIINFSKRHLKYKYFHQVSNCRDRGGIVSWICQNECVSLWNLRFIFIIIIILICFLQLTIWSYIKLFLCLDAKVDSSWEIEKKIRTSNCSSFYLWIWRIAICFTEWLPLITTPKFSALLFAYCIKYISFYSC